MKLNKIAEKTYSFQDAIISSIYFKQDKTFLFTVERIGYCTVFTHQKNVLTMSNEIEDIYNGMKPINNSVDTYSDLNEDQIELVNYIFNPMEHEITANQISDEIHDEVLIALNKYLETKSDEDYAFFKEVLDRECAQDLAEELAIS